MVGTDEVAAYLPLCQSLARKLVNTEDGIEFDDLVQEGLIRVWRCLEEGYPPNDKFVEWGMRSWARKMRYQTGKNSKADSETIPLV